MTLDEAWNKVGIACYQCNDKTARLALMEIRADVAKKELRLREYELRDEIGEQEENRIQD